MPLPEWIGQVLAARTDQKNPDVAIQLGLAESLAAGTTTLGEIVTGGWSGAGDNEDDSEPAVAGHVTLFRELIGLSPPRVAAVLAMAREALQAGPSSGRIRVGLSPHAPYTVQPELLRGAVELAREFGCPLAIHVAESREEIELLRDARGPFIELLQRRGVWQPGLFGGRRVIDILESLAAAPRTLVIHGNYLDGDDLALLARHRQRISVVYCPRTHAYFAHEEYPLAAMLAAGVRVAVGTDSRASNPDLSLLAELRHIAAVHPRVTLSQVLQLGTISGAMALGLEREIGSLEPGKRADLAVVSLGEEPEGSGVAGDPHQRLLFGRGAIEQTWLSGRCVWRRG